MTVGLTDRLRQFVAAKKRLLGLLSRWSRSPFARAYPPGHFYSPIPDMDDILRREEHIFRTDLPSCGGIDLQEQAQLELLETFRQPGDEFPFYPEPLEGQRFGYANNFFGLGEAVVARAIMRHFRPRRIIEVGSGFSSAAMLDISDRFLASGTRFTFIDPHPGRLESLVSAIDIQEHRLIKTTVQEVPVETFASLEAGDILFIDSSHVVRVGSDVQHILGLVLPLLRQGVVVHFHDVFWPFEYPREWILAGRAWNEAYMLRAFLQYNQEFRILFFTDFLKTFHRDALHEGLPPTRIHAGSSLWLIRGHGELASAHS